MGVARRPPNIPNVNPTREVMTDGGGAALNCVVEACVPLVPIDNAPPPVGHHGAVERHDQLWLVLVDREKPVAQLARNTDTDRIWNCLGRGYRYSATVVSTEVAHVAGGS